MPSVRRTTMIVTIICPTAKTRNEATDEILEFCQNTNNSYENCEIAVDVCHHPLTDEEISRLCGSTRR